MGKNPKIVIQADILVYLSWVVVMIKYTLSTVIVVFIKRNSGATTLKVHKIENFFDSDFGICVISLILMSKY